MTGKVFVLGATGKVGQPLVRFLAAKGAAVTAYVRNPDKVASLAGVTAVKGDTQDLDAFAAAIQGHERLFLLSSNPLSAANEPKLATIAVQAGIKQIVKLSVIDASESEELGSIQNLHGAAEKGILAAAPGVAVTFLRPGYFLQNLLNNAAEIKHKGTITTAMGNAQVAHIDTTDIAEVVAVILTSPVDEYNRMSLTLTGPLARTWDEVADVITKTLERPVRISHVEPAALIALLVGFGLPRRSAWMFTHVQTLMRVKYTGNGYTSGNVEFVLGRKARSLEQFLDENRAAFA
ncbi:hypothetical protein HK105_205270 [Polyrhizophydium stewartii]|uniref:NmrA-like domain-containing protein n=1 Tax=Polyrhizophydium stewartii TaxID=2732419 RepID=A0ABR4N6Q8_9FUNG|nr:hypothetical protein HK105_001370 [Polyrhizophydium stewartii]